jgi:hypothetical protein
MTTARRFAAGVARALSLLVFAGALADCATDAGGPSFITLGVTPSGAATGSGGSDAQPANLCVRLPVLLGSRVEKTKSFTSAIGAKVIADREGAEVTFPGADDASSSRSYSRDELELGVSQEVPVEAGGETYEIRIASGCTNP